MNAIENRLAQIRAIVPHSQMMVFDSLAGFSKSQLQQDLWVAATSGFRRDGWFVEIGAGDGMFLSNTWLLEKQLGWKGVVCEPDKRAMARLKEHRNCATDSRAVAARDAKSVRFLLAAEGEFSTLHRYRYSDQHFESRRKVGARSARIATITLNQLLAEHQAPRVVDFISIDTEGSELEILTAFDFGKWRFKCICVEHNFRQDRILIHEVLTRNGYVQVFEALTEWDDWYVDDLQAPDKKLTHET